MSDYQNQRDLNKTETVEQLVRAGLETTSGTNTAILAATLMAATVAATAGITGNDSLASLVGLSHIVVILLLSGSPYLRSTYYNLFGQ
jgi:hypothetical protein